jgi:hypothetical protein
VINLGQPTDEYFIPPDIRLIRIVKCTEKSSSLWDFSLGTRSNKPTFNKTEISVPFSQKHMTGFILSQETVVSDFSLFIEVTLKIILALTFMSPKAYSFEDVYFKIMCKSSLTHATSPIYLFIDFEFTIIIDKSYKSQNYSAH